MSYISDYEHGGDEFEYEQCCAEENRKDRIEREEYYRADKVQKNVETYCTDHCYHNAHCMEMHKDVDDAVEYLERKCEKCPLRDLRDLDM